MKKKLIKGLIIFCSIIGINPLFAFFSIPAYLIVMFFMLKQENWARKEKVVWGLVPFLVFILFWAAIYFVEKYTNWLDLLFG